MFNKASDPRDLGKHSCTQVECWARAGEEETESGPCPLSFPGSIDTPSSPGY